jgi:asparagine synthase (glutamine-hydrolysing)
LAVGVGIEDPKPVPGLSNSVPKTSYDAPFKPLKARELRADPWHLACSTESTVGRIIGKLSFDAEEPLALTALHGMLDTFVRSGHEAHDVFSAPGIALGWCGDAREAVQDPASSARGARTTAKAVGTTERHDVRAVADSSLRNAARLRVQLQDTHRFLGYSDSELVAHAYAEWGVRCIERMRGPFACAIWDENARRLILARDHVGIRPLYFALLPNHGVVFASEIRALLQDPGVGRQWCPEAIDAYLALGYVPAPLTAYGRISKIEPAHMVVIEGRRLHVEQYWDLPRAAKTTTRDDDVVDELNERLQTSLRGQLDDRCGHGVLYSGGTASSVMLSAAPHAARPIAITVAVDQEPRELARSNSAASHLGHARELEGLPMPAPALATELASHFDEPIADPSALAQLVVCTAARRHTDCAIAAHGASMLWGGSSRQAGAALWDDFHRRAIYTRGFAWHVRHANPFQRRLELSAARDAVDPGERALYTDARTLLPDCTLASAERAALAAGLELRFPFLDRDMVQFAAATPAWIKQRGRTVMYPLRAFLQRQLPRPLMPSADPGAVRHDWLPATLASMVPSVLLSPRFDGRGIVSRPALASLWQEHYHRRRDHSRRLWSLLMLELWFREFIDGDAAAEPLEYAVLKVA